MNISEKKTHSLRVQESSRKWPRLHLAETESRNPPRPIKVLTENSNSYRHTQNLIYRESERSYHILYYPKKVTYYRTLQSTSPEQFSIYIRYFVYDDLFVTSTTESYLILQRLFNGILQQLDWRFFEDKLKHQFYYLVHWSAP